MIKQISAMRVSRLISLRFATTAALVVAIEIAALHNFSPAVAQVTRSPAASVEVNGFEGDPWEPFNEKMFSFNHNVFDRFLLKPLGTVWDTIFPDPVQRSIHNALDNLGVVPRLTNNLLQLKFAGAGREVARFTINSTVGVAGLFDVAKNGLGIEQSSEDTGQTLGVYGVGPGPYLVLPFLPGMTVRDGFGFAADLAGRRRLKEQSLRPPNERSVQISRTTLYKEVADVGL